MLPLSLTSLTDAPAGDVEALLDAAFGADRRARTAYRLRIGAMAIPALSFAAWDGTGLIGTLQSWPVILRSADGDTPLIMVGPVAVMPEAQGLGVGKALMNALTGAAETAGADAMLMVGDPDYYGRWGFVAAATGGWRIDGPYEQHRLLARLRQPVAVHGELVPARSAELVAEPG